MQVTKSIHGGMRMHEQCVPSTSSHLPKRLVISVVCVTQVLISRIMVFVALSYLTTIVCIRVHHCNYNTVLSHSVPQDGWTALMLASDSGHTDVVQLLLSSGAQVDLQDEVRHNINFLIVHKTDGHT